MYEQKFLNCFNSQKIFYRTMVYNSNHLALLPTAIKVVSKTNLFTAAYVEVENMYRILKKAIQRAYTEVKDGQKFIITYSSRLNSLSWIAPADLLLKAHIRKYTTNSVNSETIIRYQSRTAGCLLTMHSKEIHQK